MAKIQAILTLVYIAKLGFDQEKLEHKWPTPPEWPFKLRLNLRMAELFMHPEEAGFLVTSWADVASLLRVVVKELEDDEAVSTGNVSGKSEPWRRGYFQTLMGLGRAAENLEGWVRDTKQKITRPAEYMVGPSNPRPKPIPPFVRSKKVPHEENCEPALPSPGVFYKRIMATEGFTTRQKIDASLAYAAWLDYKGLTTEADDVYEWTTDTAATALAHPTNVVDVKTGIIKNHPKDVPTENMLRVSTARAAHDAQHGNISTALSIFASVLKARRSLSTLPPVVDTKKRKGKINPLANLVEPFKVLIPTEYPPPPPSGNDPPSPYRSNGSVCEEAVLMTYIGEIIYASSSREEGLAWTRNAVDMAEEAFFSIEDEHDREKCSDCLKVGLSNWSTMLTQCILQAEEDEAAARQTVERAWFRFRYRGQVQAKEWEKSRWQAEKAAVEDREKALGFALMAAPMVNASERDSLI